MEEILGKTNFKADVEGMRRRRRYKVSDPNEIELEVVDDDDDDDSDDDDSDGHQFLKDLLGCKKVIDAVPIRTKIKADDDQYNFLKLEGDLKFEEVVGPDSLDNVTRKEFLVRLKDASGATIAIISSPKVKFHLQARMELWGTVDQVEVAELAIVREITKLYQKSCVPTILMQAPIYHNEVYVPVGQSIKLVGVTFENVVKMEAESGAWIVVDPLLIPSPPHIPMRRINIFGNRDQVYRALMIINEVVLEPYKLVDTEPSGIVQAPDEHKDVALDHQFPVDSSDFIKGPSIPTCRCGKPAIVRTSWTDNNPGRRFYSCPDLEVESQGFLGWVDPPMCPRAVCIIPCILRQ